jgi:hypothetical protein
MVDLAYDWSLMSWGMRAIVIILAIALALIVASPHVAVLKPIAQRLGLVQTQTIYVPINHTVVKYVNQTIVRYINQTVPVYINRTIYVPVGLNESLSAYLNDLFGWNGLRCWIVTFVYDNATPYYYEGNISTWGSMATIGTMIIPQQLLSKINEILPGGGSNATYYYPYGILELRGFPLTYMYAVGASLNITELWSNGGELFIPKNTSVPAVYLFGDWPGNGPTPHIYAAVINNTGGYMVVISQYPNPYSPQPPFINATTVFYYNRTYTVLIFPALVTGITLIENSFACNWTIVGPVDPNVIMRYPIPYAWTQSEAWVAMTRGYLSTSAIEQTYEYDTFGWWVWNMNVTAVNASLPYPTS